MSLDFNDMPDIAIEFLNYMLTIKNISKKTVSEYYYDLRTFMRLIKVTKHNADENKFKELTVNDITLDDIKNIDLTDLYSFMAILAVNLIIQLLQEPVSCLSQILL